MLPELDTARAEVLAALGDGVAGAPTRPAIDRYTGVLYRQLDWPSLPPAAKALGSRTVLIASGLWGLSAPGDPMPHYRLKMGASLPPLGKLSTWWRPHLTAALAEQLAGRLVWDLLPNEHAAAWRPAGVPSRRRVTVRFVDAAGPHGQPLEQAAQGRPRPPPAHRAAVRARGPGRLGAPVGLPRGPGAVRLAADPAVLVLSEVRPG